MIKLFITDIDGCLLEPMRIPDWEVLSAIRKLNEQSKDDAAIPPLTLCTGRPMPYAEAVAQMMGITKPIVFESAGVFHPEGYHIEVDGSFNEQARRQIEDLKQWISDEIIPDFRGMTIEFSKLMDAGLIHPDLEVIQQVRPRIYDHVNRHYDGFEVHSTDVSVNIVAKSNNKRAGLEKLCALYDVSASEVAYIGDSSGDVSALKFAGRAFAPVNAFDEVKAVAEELDESTSRAVLQAYREVVAANRR